MFKNREKKIIIFLRLSVGFLRLPFWDCVTITYPSPRRSGDNPCTARVDQKILNPSAVLRGLLEEAGNGWTRDWDSLIV